MHGGGSLSLKNVLMSVVWSLKPKVARALKKTDKWYNEKQGQDPVLDKMEYVISS